MTEDANAKLIAQARELAALRSDGLRKYAGEQDIAMAQAVALGRAQHLLSEMAAALERDDDED